MADTLIPSMSLRWVQRYEQVPGQPQGICHAVPVLQQRFTTPFGAVRWIDVPMVEQERGDANG